MESKQQNIEVLGPVNYPKTVDISLTGKCQLRCPWCWGEEHTVGTVYSETDWMNLLHQFKDIGTSGVVFTGGEPLLSPILPKVLRYAKESLSLRTTLSTNAILLNKLHKEILPWVDDLGISLDGSNPKINKIMRPGKIDNFQNILDGIKLAQKEYPKIDLTVRTVIARPNIDDVKNIPRVLKDSGVDLSHIRYKLYQVEPIGPRAEVTSTDKWQVAEDECKSVESTVKKQYPDLPVTLQLYGGTSGRYYQVFPRGDAYGTEIDKNGVPQMVDLGNPMTDFKKAVEMIADRYPFISTH